MEMENCAALITGGASGMGEATARLLAAHGVRIAILDRNISRAEKVASELNGMAFACDVTNENEVTEAIETAERKHGTASICINCAGIVSAKRLAGKNGPLPLAEFETILRINLTGTFNVMRLAAARMLATQPKNTQETRGVIINTASVAAFEGQIGQVAYSASKGGIVSMTLPAARELAAYGIRVVAVAPGLVDTPLFASLPDQARAQLAAAVPFPKRLAHPDEFALLIRQIIENDMLNGCVIRLDGA